MNYSAIALGNFVRETRKNKHLSQEALAERIGVCKRTIIDIEKNTGNPKFEILCTLVRELDLPLYGNIQITHKYAQRSPRESTDGRDGMIAIGPDGRFENYISPDNIWTWVFHNTNGKMGIRYAVDRSEIESNIQPGKA